MADRSEDTFLIYDITESRFIYANASFEEIMKRSCEQLLNDPGSMLEAIHPEDQQVAIKVFQNLLRKTSNTLLDFRILRPDNTERWIRLKIYPVFDGKKIKYLTGIMEDDTARKVGIFSMQKLNGWKDSILEILAHDLRGPIGLVKTLTSAIERQLEGNEKNDILKWTKMIRDISHRNIELIQSLIKKETLDSSGVEVSKERVDLVWEIGEVMKIYKSSSNDTSKQFEFTWSQEAIYAQVDSMKFAQIINNLVSNAIKFSAQNGIIKVNIEKLEKTCLITVSDNGIGIPKSMQPILFNKYTKAGRKGFDGQESVGLGMWIVKLFAEAHGGTVWFESEENKGTTFYVEIPLGEVEELAGEV